MKTTFKQLRKGQAFRFASLWLDTNTIWVKLSARTYCLAIPEVHKNDVHRIGSWHAEVATAHYAGKVEIYE